MSIFVEYLKSSIIVSGTKDSIESVLRKHIILRTTSGGMKYILEWEKLLFFDISRQFLESDAGLIEMRENMREMYPDGSYPDETDLNFAQVLIKNYLENPEKVSWDGCVKTIASIVSNASPISNMIMASLGYLSLDGASQSSIYDEIFQKFGENRARYLTVEESMKLAALRAVLMETCRMISSPPVLFIASEKTSINGE